MNKLKNIFKIGRKTKTISPKLIEAEFQGKKQPVFLYTPYGTFINPPNDLIVGLLADQGNEESLIGMVTDKGNREELEDGEVAFGIPGLNARIYFREDGSIKFKIDDTEGGDYAVRFLELQAGFNDLKDAHNDLVSSYNSHIHITTATVGPTPTPGTIAPTTSLETPTTANIDDSKIDKIEFPSV